MRKLRPWTWHWRRRAVLSFVSGLAAEHPEVFAQGPDAIAELCAAKAPPAIARHMLKLGIGAPPVH